LSKKEAARLGRNEAINILPLCAESVVQIALIGLKSKELSEDDHDLPLCLNDVLFTVNDASAALLQEIVSVVKDKVLNQVYNFFISNV
jgi:hypothetical protein